MVRMAKPMSVLSNVFNELEISVNLKYKVMHRASNVLIYMGKKTVQLAYHGNSRRFKSRNANPNG